MLIVASGINQDGRTQGITLPSAQSQRELLQEVLEKAHLSPSQIQYIEARGTGSQAGDPIEAQSLGTILGQGRADGEYCYIGSVKTNIGHLEAAAGVEGFMKAVLAMKHQTIPPHLHVQTSNPAIDFSAMHLRIPGNLSRGPAPGATVRGSQFLRLRWHQCACDPRPLPTLNELELCARNVRQLHPEGDK